MADLSRRRVVTGAVALAGAATIGLNPVAAAQATRHRTGAQHGPSLDFGDLPVVARVRARRALEHLRVLSDRIGPRIAGTEGELRAKDYIAKVLRDLRYQVTLQPFAIADKFLGSVRVGRDTWQTGSSPQGLQDVTREGVVVDVGDGSSIPADVSGKIVFIAAVTNVADAYLTAAKRGAIAVLLGRIGADPLRRLSAFSPTLPTPVTIPVLGLAQVQAERLRERLAKGTVRLGVSAVQHKNLTSYNVIAERPATFHNPDNKVVMVTAHYDSVPGSPGANDDGSGTVLCLELARVLRHLPTNKAVRFALWGSEEYGLIGSRYYVNQLSEPDIKRIAGTFQNDMVATAWDPAHIYWLLSLDGADNATTQAVAAAAKRLGYEPRTRGPVARGSSDHVPFHEKGVPAANFSWRGEGGPALLEPTYHTPEDTIEDNISLERLQVSLELIGAAAYQLLRA
ncbi:M20/M25/M40 family metallo-hydrolase [Kibdelosporangium persicum]|uniref:Aminopeptidase YwaD n=1 Tax=Kibdelosporangium persicum TaxID=2698649 RepID=A0ABX2F9F1_9PSEU|nr:M20/M25/M40 family metallo-hydrolase [Kibdelosporangium persicum]NRN67754.1 Aminopeptidase YwaD [Kibdelosporangium persicum]